MRLLSIILSSGKTTKSLTFIQLHQNCQCQNQARSNTVHLFVLQDCLDPPLTALPTTLWMCPNHPEQFIVSICEYQIRKL